MGADESALTQPRAWLAGSELPADGRLAPERELCELLGVTRNERRDEHADDLMHRTVAEATRDTVLTPVFEQLNAVRRAIVRGRLRVEPDHPPGDHHGFDEHEAIVAAIAERNRDAAFQAMYDHLVHVRDNLVDSRPPRLRRSG